MTLVFIWPGIGLAGFNSLHRGRSNEAVFINHGICSLSAVLREKGHQTTLIDLRSKKNWDDFENSLEAYRILDLPDAFLIGFHSSDAKPAEEAIRICKMCYPNIPIIVGGAHISAGRVDNFGLADCIVYGEGEITLPKLVENLDSLPKKIQAESPMDLNSLPYEDRELFNTDPERHSPIFRGLSIPHVTMLFSRGCPYQCSYCHPSRNLIAGTNKFRSRSVDHVLGELRILKVRYDSIGSMMVHDDLFPLNKKWTPEFIDKFGREFKYIPFWCQMRADYIVRHKDLIKELAKVGFKWCSLGAEAGSQRMLDLLNKHISIEDNYKAVEILHENKVNIFCNYISGLPGETEEDMALLEKFVAFAMPQHHSASIYTSYPGSDLYEYIKANDLWDEGYYDPSRVPFSRKIKGIDYAKVSQRIQKFNKEYTGVLYE